MPTFHPPVYSKHTDTQSGNIEPCYTFTVDFTKDEGITFVADDDTSLTSSSLQVVIEEHQEWWTTFLKNFMQASAKLFAKPYTVEQVNKITKHNLNSNHSNQFPATITLLPKTIQIRSGIFWVKWEYLSEPIIIDIPALPEADTSSILIPSILPDLNEITNDVEEFNLDEVPMDKNATDSHFEINHSSRIYDKQKVKEAKLKAKLALYRAQSKMRMYYDKYGNEVSDSDSDSEEDSEEDVQL